jgi:hypothetical protein
MSYQNRLISSDRELIDLGAQMLTAWWRLTIQALFDTVGSTKTLEIITPNMKAHAPAVLAYQLKMFKQLGYKDCPDYIISSLSYQVQHIILRRTFKDLEITAKGLKGGEIISCPFQSDSIDVCRIICDLLAKIIVSNANPDLEFIPGPKLTAGDPFCMGFLIYKGKPMWDEGETIAVLRRPRIPDELIDYILFAWMGEMWAMACNSAMEFFGEEEALELLRSYMMQNGMSTAHQLQKKLKLIGNDAQIIGEIIDYCNLAVQQKGQILVSSPNHFEKEIRECPFYGMSHTICSGLLTARSNGICNAINPEFGFFSDQHMCKGDKVCHWVIKKK